MTQRIPYFMAAVLLFAACSASKKAFNKAKEYEQAGLYVEATEHDLEALHKKPDFKEARVHLKTVAPKAYDELLTRAQNLEIAENWDQAVREYEHLHRLLRNMQRYGVALKTVNIKQRLSQARRKAAAYHYSHAERFFQKENWQKAALAYIKAHDYVNNYKRSFDKAVQSYLNLGDLRLNNRKFARATEAYREIFELAPGHEKANEKLADSHYRWGQQLYDDGRYRDALKRFEQVSRYVTPYRDAQDWVERSYDAAVQYVAVFPFQNETEFNLDGYLIAQEIVYRAIDANLKFADFLGFAEAVGLLDENRIRRYQPINEARLTHIARQEQLDSFVWGQIRTVVIKDRPQAFKEHQYSKIVVVDSAGKKIETTEPVYVREYTRSRHVHMTVQVVIIETETGRYLDRQRYQDDLTDEARWIAYQGSIYDLPKAKRALLDAPRNPRPPVVLVNEMLATISKKISRDVVRFYK
ncbi:MAG: tetratricopeptide repeat protein [bacterium]